MKITCGNQTMEIRDWADDKALVLTRDERIKTALMRLMEDEPDALEPLTEDAVPEDFEGVFAAVADRERLVVVFDLFSEKIGFALYTEADEEECS